MSQRPTKTRTLKSTTSEKEEERNLIQDNDKPLPLSPPNVSFSSRALASTANVAKHLPSGTLFAFQLLTPVFTNNGSCDLTARLMTQFLLLILAVSAFLACFTDSFHSREDNRVYYGLATRRGMWLFDYPTTLPLPDLSGYRLRFVDGVHGVLSVLVFGSVALRDKNVVDCFYPEARHETQEVLDAVPLAVGLLCALLFMVFPTTRRGIGYPVTNAQ